jgi:hypothetical protein
MIHSCYEHRTERNREGCKESRSAANGKRALLGSCSRSAAAYHYFQKNPRKPTFSWNKSLSALGIEGVGVGDLYQDLEAAIDPLCPGVAREIVADESEVVDCSDPESQTPQQLADWVWLRVVRVMRRIG